jgi:TRAP-type mannitol/chloroaromatic compound transport system substrate-binding protein
MDANMLLSWFEYGGGKQFYEDLHQNVMKFDIVGFIYGPMPTQPLGWFKKQVTSSADFKGLKYRTVGLSVDVFKEMGAAVVSLPGGEIVPGLDRGLIDAAEFNNASSDRLLGFPDVSKICMLQSYHQPLEAFEIMFNKKRYDALPADIKAIIANAAQASSADMSWKAIDRYSKDYEGMKAQGVKFYRTPKEILQAQLAAWDKVVTAKSAENPLFAKIIESQRKFAARVVPWSDDFIVSNELAVQHYFGKKA